MAAYKYFFLFSADESQSLNGKFSLRETDKSVIDSEGTSINIESSSFSSLKVLLHLLRVWTRLSDKIGKDDGNPLLPPRPRSFTFTFSSRPCHLTKITLMETRLFLDPDPPFPCRRVDPSPPDTPPLCLAPPLQWRLTLIPRDIFMTPLVSYESPMQMNCMIYAATDFSSVDPA